ncbi:MAG: thiamine pyrophosphate-binding protein [Rhodospirillales bacterium CG15_BIG_FIL_POST_REV_8_21_14_020_66_15]|nr:MAG: thiamine pyrophosphate-binding protein [Rhodospirillales bacterium CG15_BIG_FIL_POST_REV_8_21_14_020_66_15]
MRGADLLVKSLTAAGVKRIFSLSGNQIMPVYDACFDAGIEIVHTRHESAAVFMAEAYAQFTGDIGVAMVTAGAGAANAMGGLFTASESESPVLLLTGDSPVAQDGRGAFQEMQQVSMTAPLTKLSFRPMRAADLGLEAARAIRAAKSGRPGPVHMALPFDVVEADASVGAVPPAGAFQREAMALSAADARRLAGAVAAARRPIVICGPVLNATRSPGVMERLAGALDAPVVSMESPRGLKDPSLGSLAGVLAEADLVVNLGKRVDYTLAFGGTAAFDPGCRWICVNGDADERDRAHRNLHGRLAAAFAADPRDAVPAIAAEGAGGTARAEWRARVTERIAARSFAPGQAAPGGGISPAQVCAAVQRQLDRATDGVLICDGGEFGQWVQAATQAGKRMINGVSGAIGGAIGYGLGAKKALPGATVFALMGDGTVGFHFAEFETAARANTPYVVVIGNDRRWNAEHQIQLRDYGPNRLIGCELSGARYDLAVEGLGGHGEYVTDPAELDAALDRAVASGKVACVNVEIEGLPAPSGPSH